MLVHGPDKYKTQKMCGKAVDDCLVALKLIPDQFVASKIIDDNIYSIQNKVCGNAVFSCNEQGILNIDHNNIKIDDTNYNVDDAEAIIHIRLLAWQIKFEKRKALKKRVQ